MDTPVGMCANTIYSKKTIVKTTNEVETKGFLDDPVDFVDCTNKATISNLLQVNQPWKEWTKAVWR